VELSTSTPLGSVLVSLPSSVVKITRNRIGNAKVKNAAAGLRQNALFSNGT
jgi:hypothetical protein